MLSVFNSPSEARTQPARRVAQIKRLLAHKWNIICFLARAYLLFLEDLKYVDLSLKCSAGEIQSQLSGLLSLYQLDSPSEISCSTDYSFSCLLILSLNI